MTDRALHRWIVDGVEEGIARVVEDGARTFTVPCSILPATIAEGDVLTVSEERDERQRVRLVIEVDVDATARARTRARDALERTATRARRDDPGGDVAL